MSTTIDIQAYFSPTERQRDFLKAVWDHDFVLYGGAAGGGKSHVLRWALIMWLLEHSDRFGARVGLFCEDYPSLRDRHLSKLRHEIPRELGVYKESTHELLLTTGGVLAFRNLDDPSKYLSAEFAVVAVDELTRNERSVFDMLRSRLRWPGIKRPKFLAATNPGGTGHAWVKQLWIDHEFPPELRTLAPRFAYVPAKASDNPYLASSYYENLKTLPPDLARAYADGDWDVFAGQVFQEWRREIHVCPDFPIPSWWRRWTTNDPGYADPSVWYWMAADGDGNVYVYRELTLTRTAPSEQTKAGRALEVMPDPADDEKALPEPIDFRVTGMDAFIKHPETGKSPVDYYELGGMSGFIQPDHGAGARARMAQVVHEYLRPFPGADGRPTAKLKVFASCKKLIETLPSLPADENKPEQVAECAIDHWYQAMGYGLQAWHARRSTAPPIGYKPSQTAALLDHQKFHEEEERQRRREEGEDVDED